MKHKKERFPGFPAGKLKVIPIPGLFFAELLPAIDDLAELKLLLHLFWRISQQKRQVKGVTFKELRQDDVLLKSLNVQGGDAVSLVDDALRRAVERGSLLRIKVAGEDEHEQEWFFLNTEGGRNALRQIQAGEIDLGGEPVPEESETVEDRPNIFILYEQNIGLLQPLIVEELQEAELLYPPAWIEDAFKLAVEKNARNWRYIRTVLERWQVEGRGDEESGRDYREDGRSYLKGKYSDFIKH